MNTKIAYITDIHLDEQFTTDQGIDARKNWQTILKDITDKEIDEIIFGGDIGKESANKWFFESLRAYNIAISLGNHDSFNEVTQHYDNRIDKTQTELYYTQERGFYKFIFLDSSTEMIGQEQLNWLKNELLTTKKIVIFIHHPILAINAAVDKKYALKNRLKIKEILFNIKNEITIFSGHYHFNDKSIDNNITQYVTAASSYQVEKLPNEIKLNNETFGYRIIELSKNEITTNLVSFLTN
ncbi:metallophosphoesterase family protein [Aquimarina sp. 2201CG14-23]|uniref:metallophosphoesterase family protein n=1 Tax=Aquimarina mycalae TaxID=3040073 RepID=UPI002477E931|nr:metallophosphoesterase [Aquimarina sp. 2201CG14-23]MDH7445791.1 metallophosphoesterase [Aquimarina sp. 2201CG14-23]